MFEHKRLYRSLESCCRRVNEFSQRRKTCTCDVMDAEEKRPLVLATDCQWLMFRREANYLTSVLVGAMQLRGQVPTSIVEFYLDGQGLLFSVVSTELCEHFQFRRLQSNQTRCSGHQGHSQASLAFAQCVPPVVWQGLKGRQVRSKSIGEHAGSLELSPATASEHINVTEKRVWVGMAIYLPRFEGRGPQLGRFSGRRKSGCYQ